VVVRRLLREVGAEVVREVASVVVRRLCEGGGRWRW